MPMKPYVIKQGDYLTRLAHRLGFVAEEVWSDPKNSELKKLRTDPEVLKPGDVLYIPDEPKKKNSFTKESDNRFVARVPKVPVEVALSHNGEPLAGAKFIVKGIGDETPRETDGDGVASFEVDVHAREAVIELTDKKQRFRVLVGTLDPINEPSGARMRLTNLGYYGATLAGEDRYVAHDDKQLRAALSAFQRDKGIAASGELDEATQNALRDAHGA